jgi:hypothetical protein
MGGQVSTTYHTDFVRCIALALFLQIADNNIVGTDGIPEYTDLLGHPGFRCLSKKHGWTILPTIHKDWQTSSGRSSTHELCMRQAPRANMSRLTMQDQRPVAGLAIILTLLWLAILMRYLTLPHPEYLPHPRPPGTYILADLLPQHQTSLCQVVSCNEWETILVWHRLERLTPSPTLVLEAPALLPTAPMTGSAAPTTTSSGYSTNKLQ